MDLQKLKELAVPVSERLPTENGMYVTISNLGEKMIESYDLRHKFFNQTEYWIDFDLLTTKKKAIELATDAVEFEMLKRGKGYDFIIENQNEL